MNQRLLMAAALLLLPLSASAQQRPLVTEDPETIGAGRSSSKAASTTAATPSSRYRGFRDIVRFPLIGVSIGVSSIAEIQIDGGFYNRLSITERAPHRSLEW